MPGADAGLLGQVHRRAEAADVDLLAHDQFPQLALGPAVDRLHVLQADRRRTLHKEGSGEKRNACRAAMLCAVIILPRRRHFVNLAA